MAGTERRRLSRRTFFKSGAVLAAAAAGAGVPGQTAVAAAGRRKGRRAAQELSADIVIIGGGLGGCAAALGAAREGKRVILTEETLWIGGQVTSQAVPPDENRWVDKGSGSTRLYREYRERVRDYYRRNYPLTDEARNRPNLNPGHGRVSPLCHEPRVSLAVLHEMLAPYISGMRITLLQQHKAVGADCDGDKVRSVTVRDLSSGDEVVLHAPYILDATEFGDLLPLTKTEYVTGAEAASETGEMHAPEKALPQDIQAFTYCFAMDWLEGEDHTIDKPADYSFWRNYVPDMTPAWSGPLLDWRTSHPHTCLPRDMVFDPKNETKEKPGGLWVYRRIAFKDNFAPGTYPGDICLVNWPQNDYWLGNIYEVSDKEAAEHLRRARQLSLSLFYWMQTEAPRPDGGTGWPGLRLRGDVTGTDDGIAMFPYVRESRRIKAEFTVLEQHVGKMARAALLGKPETEVKAEVYPDSVGIGYYRIDLHPSSNGDGSPARNYIDVDSLPFQIPLGALIPRRVENLLPACKNLGVTHITNGCYRLHPVEWNIGEAAGALAAFCLENNSSPRAVRNTPGLLSDFQRRLGERGVLLEWPQTE